MAYNQHAVCEEAFHASTPLNHVIHHTGHAQEFVVQCVVRYADKDGATRVTRVVTERINSKASACVGV